MNAKGFVKAFGFADSVFVIAIFIFFACIRVSAQDLKPVYQINCGGPAVGSYSADAFFEGGKTYTTTTRVDTSGNQDGPSAQVYNTQRYGNFTYTFPNLNPGGAYAVRLHFAETYFADPRPNRVESPGVGKRVFVVMINHKVVLDRFDILATAVPNHALVKEFNSSADSGGKIRVVFQSMIGSEAMVNAIEILQSSGVSTATQPQTVPRSKVITTKVIFNSQNPCDNQDAREKKGFWDRGFDDFAMADATFPKDQYPVILKKADQAMAILKRAIPDLSGIDIKAYRSIRGDPYVKDGPVPFGVAAPVFGYFCLPLSATDPNVRGTIALGGETGTWLHIDFNSISRLPSAGTVHLVNGARVYWMPKIEGEVDGLPVLVPQRLDGGRDEELVVTPDGQLPFKPVSREAYLLGRQKAAQAEVDRLSKLPNISASGMAQRQGELESITNYLNSMSDEEKKMQAVVKDPNAFPAGRQKVFVTEAEGGYPLVTLSAKPFQPASSRAAVRLITVFWKFMPGETLQQSAVRQLKANLDVAALKLLLDQ